jgi:hypothetical protein
MARGGSATAGRSVGTLATLLVGVALLGFALSVDFPRAAHGFKGDEATYYSLAHSLARDYDFSFTRADLVRVWDEFPTGPEGIFLKRGRRVTLRRADAFPWVRIGKPYVVDRLFYGKSFIYPLVAAPFVRLFGTNGFLVLHALLLTICFGAAVAWLEARGSPPPVAVAYAAAFLGVSVVPVYLVWLTPELFNFSLVFFAFFLWSYKENGATSGSGRWARVLSGPGSDYLAATLLGVATFSKPVHIVLIGPLVALALWRRQWARSARICLLFVAVTGLLFMVNYVTTGDANYQGGNRKTFYGYTGFPFANPRETFETTGQARATDGVPLNIVVTKDAPTVFGYNLAYFTIGRYSGFVPYFFPGVVSLVLFLAAPRRRPLWQWLTVGVALVAAIGLILYMPYTYSGGGGPVGNRYYLSFYPLFLFVTPALTLPVAPLAAMAIGALFTAPLVMNPFDMSFDPGAHAKSGPIRILPIELTQLIDLPVSAKPDRSRIKLAGDPPMLAYFPDDNAYRVEGDAFWVRGRSRADIILRAPAVDDELGTGRPIRLQSLAIEIENGGKPNEVLIRTGGEKLSVPLAPGEQKTVTVRPGTGLPYRPLTFPTNYLYSISITSENGFVPFLETPESTDSRVLGARIRLLPTYDRGM